MPSCSVNVGDRISITDWDRTFHIGMQYEVVVSYSKTYHNYAQFRVIHSAERPRSHHEACEFFRLGGDNRLTDMRFLKRAWDRYGTDLCDVILSTAGSREHAELLDVLGDSHDEARRNLSILLEHFAFDPGTSMVISRMPGLLPRDSSADGTLASISSKVSRGLVGDIVSYVRGIVENSHGRHQFFDVLDDCLQHPWDLYWHVNPGLKRWQLIDRSAIEDLGMAPDSEERFTNAISVYASELIRKDNVHTCVAVSELTSAGFFGSYINHRTLGVKYRHPEWQAARVDGSSAWITWRSALLQNASRRSLLMAFRSGHSYYVVHKGLADMEQDIAERFFSSSLDESVYEDSVRSALDDYELKNGCKLDASQRDAVINALLHTDSVIVGKAGYGKSTCISALCWVARAIEFADSVLIMALSGKACQRLRDEVPGDKGKKYRGYKDSDVMTVRAAFTHGVNLAAKTNLIIVDEASMLGTSDFAEIVESMNPSAHLVLVGDDAQLMPIEAGDVFSELIAYAKSHPVGYAFSELLVNHRFEGTLGGEGTEDALDDIRMGLVDRVMQHFDDMHIHLHEPVSNPPAGVDSWFALLDEVVDMYESRVKRCGDDMSCVGLLSAAKRPSTGPCSCLGLNLAVRERMNPCKGTLNLDSSSYHGSRTCDEVGYFIGFSSSSDDSLMRSVNSRGYCAGLDLLKRIVSKPHRSGKKNPRCDSDKYVVGFRIGDRVMCNTPGMCMANNGDVGTIASVSVGANGSFLSGLVKVVLDRGVTVEVPLMDLADGWQLGYAVTVHKAQGSEYNDVLFCIPDVPASNRFLCRNMFYTAATRIRRRLDVFGTASKVRAIIDLQAMPRMTLLSSRMDALRS